jgi:ketosteroid isomerase-like protein
MPTPFRAAVEAGDWDAARALLHDDVVFRSPAVFKPYAGKAACAHLLRHVEQVFADFRYVDELDDGDRVALVFEATVDGKQVQGLDHLRLDADGRIVELTVMIRPLSGLIALATAMGARLEEDPVPG